MKHSAISSCENHWPSITLYKPQADNMTNLKSTCIHKVGASLIENKFCVWAQMDCTKWIITTSKQPQYWAVEEGFDTTE